jgi:kumamolisin
MIVRTSSHLWVTEDDLITNNVVQSMNFSQREIMKNWKWVLRISIGAVTILALAGAFTLAAPFAKAASQGSRATISGHTIPALAHNTPTGSTAHGRVLPLSIALTLRNRGELDALIRAQNDPHSSFYHHFLTPQEFARNFAPTQASINAVVNFLHSQGLRVGSIAPNHLLIDASGTVDQVQKAFQVNIANYSIQGRGVHAPTNEPSVPSSLNGLILNIGGLDDVGLYHPQISAAVGGHAGSGPGGGFTPSELRTAYDMNPLVSSNDGTGQTVAIFELDGYKAADVNTYLSNYGLGSAKYSNVLVDGATNTAGAGAIEVELDMEVVSAIAPGANQRIYIGPNTTQGVNDTYNRIVTDNISKVTSTSWGLCEASSGTSELSALNQIFAQGAAQGQAVFAASGDSGAYDCNTTTLAVDSPASDPNVVGVGGTNLQAGTGGSYISESAWNCATCSGRGPRGTGGGGGISSFFNRPSYQTGTNLTNARREVPDISADADPASGYSVFCTASASGCPASGWIAVGGTSAAAPLWAGIAADTNAYLTSQSKPVLGSASATIYRLYNTSQTFTAYHDITSGNNLFYNAVANYDNATGIGTPDVWNFARDAAGTSGGGSAPTVTSFSPTSGAVGTSVSLTGTNFTGATAVRFNGTSATFTVNSATSISTSVPTGATTGPISVTNASGTGTSATSFTVTGGGGGSTVQLLTNPGFESGQSPWSESSSGGFQLVDSTRPHTGTMSAFLCGYNRCSDAIWQTVTLRPTTTRVVLSYWLYFSTSESGSTCFDNFFARLRTSSGSTITTVQTRCNANASGWTQFSFDVTSALSGFSGQQIQVYFLGTTDSSLISSMFVDDVQLNDTFS